MFSKPKTPEPTTPSNLGPMNLNLPYAPPTQTAQLPQVPQIGGSMGVGNFFEPPKNNNTGSLNQLLQLLQRG